MIREALLRIEERIERLEDVAERWDVPGGSRALARRARDKAEGLRVARRMLASGALASPAEAETAAADGSLTEAELASRTYMAVEGPMFNKPAVERIVAQRTAAAKAEAWDEAIALVCDCGDFDGHPGDCAATPLINRASRLATKGVSAYIGPGARCWECGALATRRSPDSDAVRDRLAAESDPT